jgi:hypothetical protein
MADKAQRKKRIEDMAALIKDFPDRFIMGSDALISRNAKSITATSDLYAGRPPSQSDTEGKRVQDVPRLNGLFDYLDPGTVLQKILSGNFTTLLDNAMRDSRKYESQQLGRDLAALQEAANKNGTTPNNWKPIQIPV